MVYFIPQKYRCPECGHECEWGESSYHPAPVLAGMGGATQGPLCQVCWERFINVHVPVMEKAK